MSLKLLQPGIQPLGQFDCLDTDTFDFQGWRSVALSPMLQLLVNQVLPPPVLIKPLTMYLTVTSTPAGTFKRPAVSLRTGMRTATTLLATTRPLILIR